MRPNAVVHLAGIAATTYSDVGKIYSTNVVGTANLFAALSLAKIEPRIVIVASSAQIYAAPHSDMPLTEESAVAPETHYALANVPRRISPESIRSVFPLSSLVPSIIPAQGSLPRFSVLKSFGTTPKAKAKFGWAIWMCFGIFPISDVLWLLIRGSCQGRSIQPPSTFARGGPSISAISRRSWRRFRATA